MQLSYVKSRWAVWATIGAMTASTAYSQDLNVSELMYHPAGEALMDGGEPGEFIELHNYGETAIDLSGFSFDDGVEFAFPADSVLPAGGFLLIAKDVEFMESTYALDGVFGPYTGSLSNGGERLRLRDALGETVFSFRYGDRGDWPAAADGAGHSLVLEEPDDDPGDACNWLASRFIGGSPGEIDNPANLEGRTETLIGQGDTGRYFKGESEPAGGTTAWTEIGFAPNAQWLSGPTGYGYSGNGAELAFIETFLSDMRGGYLSVYVRLAFELTALDLETMSELTVNLRYDDGYVLYLNGERVDSENVNGNPPAFDTPTNSAGDGEFKVIDLSNRFDLLEEGTNVLAIQGHNASVSGSSDFILAPELEAVFDPPPVTGDPRRRIVINEILAAGGEAPDWVEFYNPTGEAIDLSGTWMSDDEDELNQYQLPAGTEVAPLESLQISQTEFGFGLSSDGERILLTEPDLNYVLAAYQFGPQTSGVSIGRYPDGGRNWYSMEEPTPGLPNERRRTHPVVINELMYHAPGGQEHEYIELLNSGEESIDLSGWTFRGVEFEFPDEFFILPGEHLVIIDQPDAVALYGLDPARLAGRYRRNLSNGGERISLLNADDIVIDTVAYDDEAPWPLTPDGLGASLERRCLSDQFDNPDDWSASPLDAPTPLAANTVSDCSPLLAHAVIINEIMYNSSTDVEDERGLEFIELFNKSNESVNLDGWILAGDVDFFFPDGSAIPPGGYLLVARDPDRVAEFYDRDPATITGPYSGDLPNGGGLALLIGNDGRQADSIEYDDDWPWPSLADGFGDDQGPGNSLERICADAPSTDVSNWKASSPNAPTPGRPNTGAGCDLPPAVVAVDVTPEIVTAADAPIIQATIARPDAVENVQVEYWVDDPEVVGESVSSLTMTQLPETPNTPPGTREWSATLPSFADNSIVRYRIEISSNEHGDLLAPDTRDDAFQWRAYFVDPLQDSNLPNNYHLFISAENWQQLSDNIADGRVSGGQPNPTWQDEVPAVFVAEGVVHDVEVRYQGSRWNRNNGGSVDFDCESPGSFNQAPMRSFRIDFPSYRRHRGQDVLILQKQGGWPQHISFRMFEQAGVPAPRTSWANLRINGCDYNTDAFQIERPGNDQVARWFDEVGDLFKSQGFTGDEGPWSWGDARLIEGSFNGFTEQERYEYTYNRKTLEWKNNEHDGIPDVVEPMIEGLNLARGQGKEALREFLMENFDVELTLRYICTINYVGTFDDMFQNHFLYRRADNGKWCMFPWDMDNSLGGSFGEADANPFRGADQDRIDDDPVLRNRIGDIGNRSGWWNRIKDSFFIAFEEEFLEMFLVLNNTVLSPDAMRPIVEEAAAMRGFGQNSVENLLGHMQQRRTFLNDFIEPLVEPRMPDLTLSSEGGLLQLRWPSSAFDTTLQVTDDLRKPWIDVTENIDHLDGDFSTTFETDEEPQLFFRLRSN